MRTALGVAAGLVALLIFGGAVIDAVSPDPLSPFAAKTPEPLNGRSRGPNRVTQEVFVTPVERSFWVNWQIGPTGNRPGYPVRLTRHWAHADWAASGDEVRLIVDAVRVAAGSLRCVVTINGVEVPGSGEATGSACSIYARVP